VSSAAAGARSGPVNSAPARLPATGVRRRGRSVRAAGAAAGVVVRGRARAGQGGRVVAAARARRARHGARGARAGAARPAPCWPSRRGRGCTSALSVLQPAPASAGLRLRCSQAAKPHARGLPADIGPRCSAQGPADGALAAALAAGLPAALYAAAFRGALARPTHAWSLLLLASAPVLCLACLKARRRGTRGVRTALRGHARKCLLHGTGSSAPFHAVEHPLV